ncbi:chemotaxis protein CheW [Paraburkholderia bengalensis]|uniref:Chemotaxis protein CheW n=1 Tax=Paraburkholderia bengalensis TaxID=2747562 RepID=A0ABU8J5G7_9BURK
MLFLLFELDGDRYALDAADIVEVQALCAAKAIPGAPAWVAGVVERDGEPVPVVDVAQLALGRASQQWRSTRLVFVRYRQHDDTGAPDRLLGLVVEQRDADAPHRARAFRRQRLATPHARWLGPVASDALGMIQWIDVQQMLGDDVKALLFPQPVAECPSAPQ